MKRTRQTLQDLLDSILPISASWLDQHAETVVRKLKSIPNKKSYQETDVVDFLQQSASEGTFGEALTIIHLFLDLSKDEFTHQLRETIGPGTGITRFRKEPANFVKGLTQMGLLPKIRHAVNDPVDWTDILVERLKGGRGSAIKGQQRGRDLEDFVEAIVKKVYGNNYQARCRFVGFNGQSTEKTDFAIPTATDPQILIEVKAYGATGSKQTDVLGDISRIVSEKRNDTHFFLFTDGITWKERSNDLKKLVKLQNQGDIAKSIHSLWLTNLRMT